MQTYSRLQKFTVALTACTILVCSDVALAKRAAIPQSPTHASDLSEILKKINAEDSQTKYQGLDGLLRMEPPEAAAPALPAIIAITKLQKKDPNDYLYSSLQSMAFQLLGRLPKTDEAAKALFAALKQDEDCKQPASPPLPASGTTDREKRIAAEKALAAQRPLPAATSAKCNEQKFLGQSAAHNIPVDDIYLPQVLSALKHDDPSVRNAIVERFRTPPTLSEKAAQLLISVLLHDPESMVKTTAAQIIADKEKDRTEFAPALITAIKGETDKFRKLFYVHALATSGGTPVEELPLLITLLSTTDENNSTRYYSAQVIGSLGAKAASAVPALTKAITSDPDNLVRGYSAEALGKIGTSASEAIPALITMLNDRGTSNYRFYAAEALGKIATKENKEATGALLAALNDQETGTQGKALSALQAQHNNSPEVLDALKKLQVESNSPNASLYLNTIKALSGNEQANVQLAKPLPIEEKLLQQLNDADQQVQGAAVSQVKQLPTIHVTFIPGLIKALSSKDPLTTWYACEALGKAGTAAKDAAPPIMSWLKLQQLQNSGGSGVQYCSAALARIAPEDKTVLTFLSDAMLGGKVFASDDYANALALTGDAGIPYLIEGLKSDNLYTIYLAAQALSRTNGDGKPAVPLLVELLNQPKKLGIFTTQGYKTSDRIIEAIQHIAPDSPELAKAQELHKTLPPPVSNR